MKERRIDVVKLMISLQSAQVYCSGLTCVRTFWEKWIRMARWGPHGGGPRRQLRQGSMASARAESVVRVRHERQEKYQ